MAKLASENDTSASGEVFIVQPGKDLAERLGVMFGIIEIYNANDSFVDNFLEAINDLKTEYYLPPHQIEHGLERRFEEALSRTNRRLQVAITQSIEEIDLRNISTVVGLICGNKIYLAATGRIRSWLFRHKKNSELLTFNILNESQKPKPETEKLFANILNGELGQRDAMLFANEELMDFFSASELGEMILKHPIDEMAKLVETELGKKNDKKNVYAIILKPQGLLQEKPPASPSVKQSSTSRLTSPANRIDNETPPDNRPAPPKASPGEPQYSIDKLLYTQVKTEKYLTPSLLPSWQKILLLVWRWLKKSGAFIARHIKKIILATIGIMSGWSKRIQNKKKQNGSLEQETPMPSIINQSTNEELLDGPIIDEITDDEDNKKSPPNETRRVGNESLTANAVGMVKTDTKSNNITEAINGFINKQIVKLLTLKKRQKIILIAALIFLFVFAQSVVMIGRSYDTSNGNLSGNSQLAKQIEDELSNAEAQNIFSDEAGALKSIKTAQELLAQIPDNIFNHSLRTDLSSKITQTIHNLERISYLENPTVTADLLSNQASTTPLVGLAKTGKVFWTYDNGKKSLWRFDTLTNKLEVRTTTLPQVKKLTALDDKNLLLLANNGGYYKYDINKKSAAKTRPSKDYFNIKNFVSASALLDPPLASSTIAMATISESYNFFLDASNTRLIVFDKNSALKRQYVSPKFSSANSFAISYKDKKAWIFAGGKIYQVDLDF